MSVLDKVIPYRGREMAGMDNMPRAKDLVRQDPDEEGVDPIVDIESFQDRMPNIRRVEDDNSPEPMTNNNGEGDWGDFAVPPGRGSVRTDVGDKGTAARNRNQGCPREGT